MGVFLGNKEFSDTGGRKLVSRWSGAEKVCVGSAIPQ